MSFAALKKQSKAGSLTERLMKKVEKLNEKGGSNTDERLWKPSVDKAGNGFAVIRFLLHMPTLSCHGLKYGVMHFKGQVVGILKTV